MTTSAVLPAQAPLTRRQIREAERAREAALRAAEEAQSPVPEQDAAPVVEHVEALAAEADEPAPHEVEQAFSEEEPVRVMWQPVRAVPASTPAVEEVRASTPAVEIRASTPAVADRAPRPEVVSRRQLREAARRDESGANRAERPPAATASTPSETRATARTRQGAAPARRPGTARANGPAPTRREQGTRAAGRRRTSSQRPRGADAGGTRVLRGMAPRALAPRAAVLGALGALTIAAPLSGFASSGAAEVEPQAGVTVSTETSLLETLDAAAAASTLPDESAGSLMAAPAAADRAVVQTSRSLARAGTCSAAAAASGTRAAALRDAPSIVLPMASGTYRLSSGYGSRLDPFTGGYAQHLGSDFSAPMGTPIHAVAAGTVVHAGLGKDGRSSMLIIVEHEVNGEHFYSWYVHMYPEGVYVGVGQQVEAGEVIGAVGSNGRSTGPHLHLEIHLDDAGTTTDALAWLNARGAQDVSGLC